MAQRDIGLMSVLDYLKFEEAGETKHEYVAGEVYALAGASRRHNRIAGNICAALLTASRAGPCRVSISDIKLRASEEVYYYPDVMVACEPEPADATSEEAPCLIVEVTSPSTQAIDTREKLLLYKRIASVQAYLIVHQDERRVERHWRELDGEWHHDVVPGSGTVSIPYPETQLAIDTIYEGTGVPL